MILDVIPVIPPELRPLVPLDGGRFATRPQRSLSRVINRNNRLKKLMDLHAPESSSATRSACCRRPSTLCSTTAAAARLRGANNRPLKSLSDTLKASRAASARTCSASASTIPDVR